MSSINKGRNEGQKEDKEQRTKWLCEKQDKIKRLDNDHRWKSVAAVKFVEKWHHSDYNQGFLRSKCNQT